MLAFVPCSLMLSVTTYITSEIAPIPLLWVIPLGIYLLTFILVFARRRLLPHRWLVRAMPFVVLPLIMFLVETMKGGSFKTLWPVALHFAALFVVGMVCHGELANDRPSVWHLTEFYLWISAGGVLGGMFNALLAPVIFPTVIEYPVTLVLACLLMPRRSSGTSGTRQRLLDVALPVALGLLTAGLVAFTERTRFDSQASARALEYGLPALLCLGFSRRPLRFALGFTAILVATTLTVRAAIHTLVVARSFFGIHRVEEFPGAEYIHILRHGKTQHGMQSLDPRQRRTPLMYFAKAGPLGQAMAVIPPELRQRAAVIGLGAGTVACYAEAGQDWTFYEIDPEVERIARDPKCFTYLEDCPATVQVVLGDARLSLRKVPDGRFGLMILDAYNSDTIPLHLLTREALALYLRKLTPTGVLVCHISNGHLDLEPVFARLAQDAGLYALCQDDWVSYEEYLRTGRMTSRWMVMTRDPPRLSALAADHRWHQPRTQIGLRTWTDDYESVFSVFMWE
jgi:spermidine synthase